MMRRLILLLFVSLLLLGCASIQQSEFWKHDSVYATNAHMAYSFWGHRNPNADAQKMSEEQGWWGTAVPYVPAE